MNLPTGYANLSVLSTFLHESRSTTIKRAKEGLYKSAKPYRKAKLEVWIIRQDELFDIMQRHRQNVPAYIGRIDLHLKPDYMGTEKEEAENKLMKVLEQIEAEFSEILDETNTTYWVEEQQ